MEVLIALVTGALFAVGLYLLMHREVLRVVVGVVLFTHAANLVLFLAGDLDWAKAPGSAPPGGHLRTEANPLLQAIILTAIVIGLGLQMFVLALVRSAAAGPGSQDAAAFKANKSNFAIARRAVRHR